MTKIRDNWGSRLAFILAAAGSAIGLGNIWRFPTVAYQNGGAAFVQIYLLLVFLIGFVVMVGEISLGRNAQRNPVGVFKKLAPRSVWVLIGFAGICTAWAVVSYYCVVAGWTLRYIFTTASGAFSQPLSQEQTGAIFGRMVASPWESIFWHFTFMALTVGIVMGGVRQGIERWSKILMPALFMIILLLVVRSVTLEGAGRGLGEYLRADWSKVTPYTFVAALGQAFFSLSLGAGTMLTYGSYTSRDENIVKSASWVCLLDSMIAFMAGLAIFPVLFLMEGVKPEIGAKLMFVVLPRLFCEIPFGLVFGTGFFLLLLVAAVTSSISLLEVPVAYFVDERGWRRNRATLFCGVVGFAVGVPSALSVGAVDSLSGIVTLGGRTLGFLDLMDLFAGQFMMTFGALMIALFVGWRWGTASFRQEIAHPGSHALVHRMIAFQIRYVCPLVIIGLMIYLILNPGAFS